MKLFLMRHAEAKEAKQMDDIFRELTNKGIQEAEKALVEFEAKWCTFSLAFGEVLVRR